jgi:hypothetical protein
MLHQLTGMWEQLNVSGECSCYMCIISKLFLIESAICCPDAANRKEQTLIEFYLVLSQSPLAPLGVPFMRYLYSRPRNKLGKFTGK